MPEHDYDFDDDFDCHVYEDEIVGSCENCGCNIYASDANLGELCDQCEWFLE